MASHQLGVDGYLVEVEEEADSFNDIDPNRYSNKEYFLKISKLYNQYVFNTNPIARQTANAENEQSQSQRQRSRKQKNEDTLLSTRITQNFQTMDKRSSIGHVPTSSMQQPLLPSSPLQNMRASPRAYSKSPVSSKSGALLQKQAATFNSTAQAN